jgi:hypothetical protein
MWGDTNGKKDKCEEDNFIRRTEGTTKENETENEEHDENIWEWRMY